MERTPDSLGKDRILGNVIDQRAQQIDPAGHHRVDANAAAAGSRKQPGNSENSEPESEEEETKEEQDHRYVRPAGRKEMDNPPREWSRTDEESDESFPASDPPGNY